MSAHLRFGERAPRPDSVGFTLIELIFAVAILGVLMTLGAPYMANVVRDQRIKTATFDVYGSIIYARSEAIRRNASVQIVPAGSDWAGGWTVSLTSGGTLLRNQDLLPGVRIAKQDGSAIGNLTYRGDGRLATAVPMLVVWSPDNTTINGRCISMDLGGRPNIKVDTNKDPTDGC